MDSPPPVVSDGVMMKRQFNRRGRDAKVDYHIKVNPIS